MGFKKMLLFPLIFFLDYSALWISMIMEMNFGRGIIYDFTVKYPICGILFCGLITTCTLWSLEMRKIKKGS
jgi:hypothetical protein